MKRQSQQKALELKKQPKSSLVRSPFSFLCVYNIIQHQLYRSVLFDAISQLQIFTREAVKKELRAPHEGKQSEEKRKRK